jgi:hypothetical protein
MKFVYSRMTYLFELSIYSVSCDMREVRNNRRIELINNDSLNTSKSHYAPHLNLICSCSAKSQAISSPRNRRTWEVLASAVSVDHDYLPFELEAGHRHNWRCWLTADM